MKFHKDYGISLGNIALVSTFFFFTQLLVDLVCAKIVDYIGYRTCVVAAEVTSGLGLAGLAFIPELTPSPFSGIIISVIIYAIGSGLTEVLVSPIVEACPFENKEAMMSLLHSFYCWGSVGVIVGSTLFFSIFGIENWKYIACIWAIVPLYNVYNFMTCPIEHLVEEGQSIGIRGLFKVPMFWVAIILMICAGASEISMAQWASAYTESAIGLSKTVGDLAGPCMFAVAMGISRVIYGKKGEKFNLTYFMMGSGVLCLICYLMASLSASPVIGLTGCIICGFSVGIMWPGSISISSRVLPKGGTAMFALLALAGDLGGAVGPAIIGNVSQSAGENLQAGVLAGIGFPIVLVVCVLIVRNKYNEKNS